MLMIPQRYQQQQASMLRACCCAPPAECPTDCTACAATLSVVISGLTGVCSCMNGTYSVPKTGTECIWQVTVVQDVPNNECGVTLTVDCVVGWRVTIDGVSLPPFFDSAIFRGVGAAQACPVGLTITAPRLSGGCSGQTATAVIS